MKRPSLCSLVGHLREFQLKEKAVISCFGGSIACLTFNPSSNLSREKRTISHQSTPSLGRHRWTWKQKRSQPRKLCSWVKVDRWWCSNLSLIILSVIMQKKQQHSLKEMLFKKHKRDGLLIFSKLERISTQQYNVRFNPEIVSHLSKKQSLLITWPQRWVEHYH